MDRATLSIREAQLEDAPVVWEFLQRFGTSYIPSREAFDRDYPQLLADDNSDLLVARSSDGALGYLLAHQNLTLFAGGTILNIVELYVDEAHRREGLGATLVRAAVERAWTSGCVEAVVSTRRAQSFYEGLGFEASATYLKLKREM